MAAQKSTARAPMPRALSPQLATLAEHAPTGDGWVHEVKFDGYRLLAFVERGKPRLMTRNGKDWTHRFGTIARTLRSTDLPDCILDGEAVALLPSGRPDFQTLQAALAGESDAPLAYYLFDMPWTDGNDLTRTPLLERKEALRGLLESSGVFEAQAPVVRYSEHIRGDGAIVAEQACDLGMEGIICKRADSPYTSARTKDWLKVKCVNRQELVIVGFTPPKGGRVGFGSLLLGRHDDEGRFVYSGKVGTGFDDRLLRDLHAQLQSMARRESPLDAPAPRAEVRHATWVEPRLLAEVSFTEWTGDGRLRHPVFVGLREDKPPEAITMERAIDPDEDAQAKTPSRRKRTTRAAKGEDTEYLGVRLTSPDKVLYPEQGATKRRIAAYYEAVAERMMPHAAGRPLTLVRCPQGRGGKCFYQKHVAHDIPQGLRGVPIREKSEEETYLVLESVEGLISLTQMGVLEIHTWGAHDDRVERPDALVFDLDPGPGVSFDEVKRAATDLRELLRNAGLTSFLKATGGKGLHVALPIARRTEWDDAKAFTKTVVERLAHENPSRFTTNMSKAKREKRIFLDYLRNGRGATFIAPWSTRARQGAPVAMPLHWDELKSLKSASAFDIDAAERRAQDSDPWAAWFDTAQRITKGVRRAFETDRPG